MKMQMTGVSKRSHLLGGRTLRMCQAYGSTLCPKLHFNGRCVGLFTIINYYYSISYLVLRRIKSQAAIMPLFKNNSTSRHRTTCLSVLLLMFTITITMHRLI